MDVGLYILRKIMTGAVFGGRRIESSVGLRLVVEAGDWRRQLSAMVVLQSC